MILGTYNGTMIENFLDILWYAVKHSIMIIPFLFISFILIEYLHHKHTNKMNKLIRDKGKYAPIAAGALGIIPQCGFSSTIATLYSSRVVSLGTLFSVLISTSDEAILILIAHPDEYKTLILLIILKLIIGISIGLMIDKFIKTNINLEEDIKECSCCGKVNHSIIKDSIKHTLQVVGFLILFSFIVEYFVHLIGLDTLNTILLNGSIFQPILSVLIGLIPNCGASILLTNLYISGSLSFASLLSGLMCNAGIGVLVLFKNNKSIKESIKILIGLVMISIIVGLLTSLIFLVV